MPGKRISELTALSGAGSANNDDVVIFDADASETKRISRSQLAAGMQSDVQVFSNKTIDSANNTLTINAKEARLEGTDASRLHWFKDVAALLADTGLVATTGDILRTRAEGFSYEVAASGATDQHATTAGGVKLYQVSGRLISTRTLRIPSDYATAQDAVDYLATLELTSEQAIILFEAGHKPASGMVFSNGDFSSVYVRAEDAVLEVSNTFTGNFITVNNSRGPILDCLVDQKERGGVGYQINFHSSGTISPDCGVDNAGTIGLECTTGTAMASRAIFRGAGTEGIRASIGAQVRALGVDVRNSKSMGLWVSRGAMLHCDPSDERVTNASGAAVWGIRARRGTISAIGADVSNCGEDGANIGAGSIVCLQDANLSGAGSRGIRASDNSMVAARGVNVEGYGVAGIFCEASRVDATNAKARKDGINDSASDFRVESGGEITAFGAEGGSRDGKNIRSNFGIISGTLATQGGGNQFRLLTPPSGTSSVAYILLVKKGEFQQLTGDIVGVSRVAGTNPARSPVERIRVVAGTRGTDAQFNYASVIIQGFAGGPVYRLVNCTHNGADYVALEIDGADFRQLTHQFYTNAIWLNQALDRAALERVNPPSNLPLIVQSDVTSITAFTSASLAKTTVLGE
jgi:hypothetical protein